MKKYCLLAFLLCGQLTQAAPDNYIIGQSRVRQLHINNRILATVNGNPISVYDVMKKLDMQFYRQFPEYASSTEARYQYYQAKWKQMLRDLVDKELILADAATSKVEVSAGDIRQEMETLFGPNIIANLDRLGMHFNEAEKIIQGDIILRRMIYLRVQNKALRKVTPQVVRRAYEAYARDNIKAPEWKYHVISIRDKDSVRGAETANLVYRLLTEEKVGITELKEKLSQIGMSLTLPSLTVSEEFSHSEKEVSSSYKEVLTQLQPGLYSSPITQSSRRDNEKVFRIFFMKEMIAGGVQPFSSVEPLIKEKLIDEVMDQETIQYLKQLRSHYRVKEEDILSAIPENFEPFVLK